MPFSVAELKQKASHAKDASVHSLQNTRDRFTSTSSKKATWGPYAVTQNARAPPPSDQDTRPPAKTPPAVPTRRRAREYDDEDSQTGSRIDWANLSEEDKLALFSWLDEFFSRFLDIPISPRDTSNASKQRVAQTTLSTSVSQTPKRGPPPTVVKWSKPKPPPSSDSDDLVMSHPPSTTHGSAALDLTHYFKPSTYWDTSWHSSDKPLPPPLRDNKHTTYVSSWQSIGTKKTVNTGVAFSDLSICWFTVAFSTASSADPNDTSAVKRKALYLPRPSPANKETLMEAHETYGETIAAFAESFVGTGEFCARGECWDLANEALKYFENFDYVPKPVPSLSRTHGHLIFEGKATGKGEMVGRWRGGDDRVRRGDIAEWRKVKIGIVGAPSGTYAILGDPDHTSIIVRDSQPSRPPADGQPLSPASLASLEVVEQSVRSPPDRKTYDLRAFEQGEMWIYRPIGMQVYLGTLLEAVCPSGVPALEM